MDGLPLGHHSLSLPTDYNYHHAMAQHAAAVSAAQGQSGLHSSSMGQIGMLPTGLNLTMNASSQTMSPRMPTNLGGNTHHLSHMSHMGGAMHTMPHGKKKKPKVNKDGIPAPKRAMTAYINFTQWYREDQKKNGRQIPKIGEFGKECAEKWKSMTEEEKQPFLDIAAQDRERYKKEMAIYKPARDVNKPKRPGTAFMLFMADLRKEMAGREPEGGVAALAKLGGERWRSMTDEEKRKYIEKQSEEKMRYEQLMEEYRRKYPQQQGLMCMGPVVKQPRLDEQSRDSSDSLEGSSASNAVSAALSQIPQLTQQTSNSGSPASPSRSNAQTPASQVSSSSPPPPTLSPGPIMENSSNNSGASTSATTSAESINSSMAAISSMSADNANSSMAAISSMSGDGGNSSMAAISSMSSSMSLSQAMAMGYAQQSLSNFAHGNSMIVPNFNQAHNNTTISSSPYLQSNTYTQPHLPGPYNWT